MSSFRILLQEKNLWYCLDWFLHGLTSREILVNFHQYGRENRHKQYITHCVSYLPCRVKSVKLHVKDHPVNSKSGGKYWTSKIDGSNRWNKYTSIKQNLISILHTKKTKVHLKKMARYKLSDRRLRNVHLQNCWYLCGAKLQNLEISNSKWAISGHKEEEKANMFQELLKNGAIYWSIGQILLQKQSIHLLWLFGLKIVILLLQKKPQHWKFHTAKGHKITDQVINNLFMQV